MSSELSSASSDSWGQGDAFIYKWVMATDPSVSFRTNFPHSTSHSLLPNLSGLAMIGVVFC